MDEALHFARSNVRTKLVRFDRLPHLSTTEFTQDQFYAVVYVVERMFLSPAHNEHGEHTFEAPLQFMDIVKSMTKPGRASFATLAECLDAYNWKGGQFTSMEQFRAWKLSQQTGG
jgi:hypothetical protein